MNAATRLETTTLHDQHGHWPQAESVEDFSRNLAGVRARIAAACQRVERDPADVRLLPVSKTKDAAHLRLAYAAGCRQFGENKPQAALYMFPRLDPEIYPIKDDREFFLQLLEVTRVMLVQGTGFNWQHPDHFRIVFLPHEPDLREAIDRIAVFLDDYRKRHEKIESPSPDSANRDTVVEAVLHLASVEQNGK